MPSSDPKRAGRRTDDVLEISGMVGETQPEPGQPEMMADEVDPGDLAGFVDELQRMLWWGGGQWRAEKRVDAEDVLEFLRAGMAGLGLAPKEV